ncbi:IQ motif and SEC7 domain-containing protein 3-like isoform X2 [Acipenser ruthenus]|uniref:IQ motif and SEC7 domain-containing protein 3-like isoform X2 n=1 Tax=Acipenser ruthenus TaxID=7906 RepID=UPI002741C74E|nr:IQ motif and SEC7 domain-containing protein 3-like isoform X2 [Acipenser ruthenus]
MRFFLFPASGAEGERQPQSQRATERVTGEDGSIKLLSEKNTNRSALTSPQRTGMESLLDNPMKAVLYLKELTAIVQNQQSLIQTQRQRIDELERKVEELIGENRNLKDKPQTQPVPQPQPHHYHHHPSERSTSPQPPAHLHQHPVSKATVAASTSLAAQPPLPHQQPQIPPQQFQTPEHPPQTQPQQQLQLVPASPPTPPSPQSPQPNQASPEPAEVEKKKTPCCKSLVPQKPAAICRAVVLGRKPKNETVLHQFCCPAADADQKADSSSCSTSNSMPASCAPGEAGETAGGGGGGQEEEEEAGTTTSGVEGGVGCRGGVKASLHHTASPMRVQRNKGASACSHSSTSDYELSLDLKSKQIEMLEHKYGGHLISRRAACTIQTAFRQYQLSKNFEKIRNSLLESRLPRRISLRKLRVHNTEGFSAEKPLMEGYNFMGIPLVRSPSLPATISGALTELEDSFTEQVQSLAKSIDDALSTWSLKTMCSLQDVSTYQTFHTAAPGLGAGSVEAGEAGGQESSVEEARPDALPHSGSTLMMAFRDVTVQIDNQNFCMSSSLMESTSLSLSNCLQQGGLEAKDAVGELELKEGPQDPGEDLNEFPAPPPSEEEEEEEPLLTLQKVEDAEPGVEVKRAESEMADNSSEQTSSSSTSTSAKSASEASSKEALQAMILSLPRYHCENPASCKSPTLSTDVMRKRLYRIGLNLFNVNPVKGIQFLISRGFIPDTPIGVAHFLLQRKGLSRQMIGEFLGNSKKQFNRDVLDCVVDEMDFSGMELDEALRKFQAHIRVQGEAQKVERLIEAFSQRYCICNPDVVQQFHNPDTIFILAFAIILLNTDMYSPNIKADRKMMLEDFIRNLRGVDDGADIPREMVVGIYERIQQRELRSNEDHVTYVTKVEQSILGMKTVLSVPHRRLVCCSRLFEVADVNKAQKQAAHQREVFLFNDLMVILKLCPKKKSSATYTFCKAVALQEMQFHLFENEYYPHGITLVSPYSGSDKKQVLHFCAQSAEELLKFVEDLKESIREVTEMEQIRIEWELEKQQGTKMKNNDTQLELRGKQQGSPPGKQDLEDKTGNKTVEAPNVPAQCIPDSRDWSPPGPPS